MARTGLRMMPTFPSPPLKFRTAGFPQYGFKAGLSDKACPVVWFAIVLRALCFHHAFPALCQGRCAYEHFRASGVPLYPRGPRSRPGYAVTVYLHLIGPIRPTHGHILISPTCGLYLMPSLCVSARRPLSGSVLSLYLPSPHAVLYDRGEFIGCTCSVPSPMTLAFAESLKARHSRNSHHPFPMGDGLAATLVRCFAAACRVARPPLYGSDQEFPP